MKFKSLLASCLLLCALFVSSSLLADDRFVWSEESRVSAESVINYWTKERMENAVPYPRQPLEGAFPMSVPSGTVPIPTDRKPGYDPGGSPGLKSSLSSKDSGSPELLPLVEPLGNERTPGSHGYPLPFPFTRFEVLSTLYRTYPYKTVGKVFFTSGGSNFVCSGSSIGGRAVLTAGHCVSDGAGNFHTNWAFVPAFRNNGRPFGTWAAEQLVTFTAWHVNSDSCRDVGFAVTRNVGGRRLSQRVGFLGFAWNFDSEHVHWNIFGYPAEVIPGFPPFNGQRMWECQASFAQWDDRLSCTPLPQCLGCDQTGGSSGGPWIKDFTPGVVGLVNFANSVVSTGYPDRFGTGTCGPYFDTAVKDLKDNVVAR